MKVFFFTFVWIKKGVNFFEGCKGGGLTSLPLYTFFHIDKVIHAPELAHAILQNGKIIGFQSLPLSPISPYPQSLHPPTNELTFFKLSAPSPQILRRGAPTWLYWVLILGARASGVLPCTSSSLRKDESILDVFLIWDVFILPIYFSLLSPSFSLSTSSFSAGLDLPPPLAPLSPSSSKILKKRF